MGEWRTIPLAELVDPQRSISYGIVQPGVPTADGVPIVRVSDVRDGRIATDEPLRVAREVEASFGRTRLRGGELLLTLVGTVGEAAIVPNSMAGWNTARAVAVIPVRSEIGAYWVSLVLRSPAIRSLIESRVNTTVQVTLNLKDVAQLPIPLPPEDIRKAITSIIGTLDDKIELNHRMSETLEATARALFRSWFVDFDSVAGEGNEPKRWTRSSLAQIADFLNGLALQKFPPTGDRALPVIKIAQLRAGHTVGADFASSEIDPAYVVGDGDVLFSWSGSLECELWAGGPGALNQHLFRVKSSGYPKWLYYLWIHHHLPDFRRIAAGKATTMGHIQRHHLSDARVVLPPPDRLKQMGRHFDPLIDAVVQRRLESRTLAALRDMLLPKLISGELRIKNAERFVAAAV